MPGSAPERVQTMIAARWPAFAATGGLWLWIAWLSRAIRAADGGRLVYVLDDPYISLAMGRSLAFSGVWGVTPSAFTDSSSSPAWTVLLALAVRVFGSLEAIPFYLAAAGATAAVFAFDGVMRRYGVAPSGRLLALALASIATPLAPLVFTGLEHTTHIAVMVLLAGALADAIVDRARSGRNAWALLVLAFLATALRFESIFLIGLGCAVLIAQRRWALAIAIGAAGSAPVIALGVAGLTHGWWFLPASIQLKGNDPRQGWAEFVDRALTQARSVAPLIALICVVLAQLALLRRQASARSQALGWLAVSAAAAHLFFARVGWFYRYEAYVIALAVLAIVAMLPATPRELLRGRQRIVTAVAVAAAGLAIGRGIDAHGDTVPAAAGIYRQQYQMALFLRAFYPGAPVVLNDIGAVTLLANVEPVDLAGLAHIGIARATVARTLNSEVMRAAALAAGARVGIVYDRWWTAWGGLPREWIRVRQWTTTCWICGDETVSFYGLTPAAAAELRRHLDAFEPGLPDGIIRH